MVPLPYDEDIIALQWYSNFILIQYKTFVEFLQIDNKELVESIYKISQTERIISIQHDVDQHKFVFI